LELQTCNEAALNSFWINLYFLWFLWGKLFSLYFQSWSRLPANISAFCYLWDLQFFTWEYFCNILNQDQDPDMSCYRKVPLFLGVANKLHLWSLLFLNHLQMCIYRWQRFHSMPPVFSPEPFSILAMWCYIVWMWYYLKLFLIDCIRNVML
jgi:hypothetical protein